MILEEFKNFLSQELCNSLIELSLDDLGDTETLGEQIDDYRLAQGTFLDNNEGVASIISQKVSELLSLPTENFENLHVVKYEAGGEYKTHHDFFHETENYYGEQIDRGGQRIFTTLIYLNDTFLGGETDFPLLSKKIKPETGKLVVWSNIDENGECDHDSLHAGLPVLEGTKYIAVFWIRESKFI
jgi:prolyl 4-hydroxylase